MRVFLFGDRKTKEELGFADQDAIWEIDALKMDIVAKSIVRKAQAEPLYSNFYALLCSQIARLELTMHGLAPTRSNANKCVFRTTILAICKDGFEQLLVAPNRSEKQENETETERLNR